MSVYPILATRVATFFSYGIKTAIIVYVDMLE